MIGTRLFLVYLQLNLSCTHPKDRLILLFHHLHLVVLPDDPGVNESNHLVDGLGCRRQVLEPAFRDHDVICLTK